MALTPEEQQELLALEQEFQGQDITPPPQSSGAEAALQGFGQGATLGYLPEMQALAEPYLQKGYEAMTGQELTPPEDLSSRLQKWRGREQSIREERPGAYLAGAIPGSMALPGMGAAKGLKGAVAVGAAQGALTNPETEYSLLEQLKARGKNLGVGATVGAGGVGVSKLAQKGYSKAKDLLPKLGEYFSGVPAHATKTYASKTTEVQQLGESGALNAVAEDTISELKAGLQGAKQQIGQAMDEAATGAEDFVNVGKARANIDKFIADLEAKGLKNQKTLEFIEKYKAARDEIFDASIPDQVTAKEAMALQDQLRDFADLRGAKGGVATRFANTDSTLMKRGANAGASAYKELNQELERVASKMPELKAGYKEIIDVERQVAPMFKDDIKAEKTLANLFSPSNRALKEKLEKIKNLTGGQVDILPQAEKVSAARYYHQPSWRELSGLGTTGTARAISGATLGGILGYREGGLEGGLMGATAGGAITSPAAMKHVYIPAAKGAGRMLEGAGAQFKPGRMATPWLLMNNKER